MHWKEYSVVSITLAIALPAFTLLPVGCSRTKETAPGTSSAGTPMREPGAPGGSGGRMGGPGGRSGGRFQAVAANATAPQIFQQKCQNCHGDKGQGARGPAFTKAAMKDSAELRQIIHDGHEKMPAFGNQMTGEQLDGIVAYVKQLGSAKG